MSPLLSLKFHLAKIRLRGQPIRRCIVKHSRTPEAALKSEHPILIRRRRFTIEVRHVRVFLFHDQSVTLLYDDNLVSAIRSLHPFADNRILGLTPTGRS